MANVSPEAVPPAGGHREEYVLCSGVRSGLKREFVFALKAQADLLMTPMSRTRSGKIQRSPPNPRDGSVKRRRKSSEGSDATAAPSKASEASPILPAPGDAAPQGEAEAVAEAGMAVNSGPEPVIDDAIDVAGSSAEVNGSAVEDSVSMRIENTAVTVTPPTGPVVAGATADAVPSVLVGAGTLMEAQISQIATKATADVTPSIQVESRSVMEVCAKIGTHVHWKTEQHATMEKPMRRFTRSLLKAAVKEPQPPVVDEAPVLMAGHSPTTSSGSDGSEENKDSVDTMNGPHKSPCVTPKKKLELKMSKKIALTKFPSNIRGLLATGLLDGLSVKYGTPSFHKQEGLRGVIKDGGILCFCASCKGLETISAYNFELHAGSKKKHPSDFIYLENGNTIHDVLRACSNAPLEMLESTIQNAISIEGSRSSNHDKCKGDKITVDIDVRHHFVVNVDKFLRFLLKCRVFHQVTYWVVSISM